LQQVSSPHDLVDTHESIIYDNSKLISKDAIRAADNKISYRLLYLLLYWTDQQVGEGDKTLIVYPKAQ